MIPPLDGKRARDATVPAAAWTVTSGAPQCCYPNRSIQLRGISFRTSKQQRPFRKCSPCSFSGVLADGGELKPDCPCYHLTIGTLFEQRILATTSSPSTAAPLATALQSLEPCSDVRPFLAICRSPY